LKSPKFQELPFKPFSCSTTLNLDQRAREFRYGKGKRGLPRGSQRLGKLVEQIRSRRATFSDRISLFAGAEFNERQREIVNRLLNGFEGNVTASKWAKLVKCSQDTALRDIEDLIRKKVLVKDSAGGRSTSYSLARTK
jgi:Fic family protein